MTFDPNEVLRRFHRALVREIQDSNPEHLTAPFSVAEIYQNLVPYRTHRDEIGVEMNADYEHALLRLLAGENDFLTIESRTARQEIREELESPNPNTGLYRDFAAADVRLNPEKIDEALMWEPARPDGSDGGSPSDTDPAADATEGYQDLGEEAPPPGDPDPEGDAGGETEPVDRRDEEDTAPEDDQEEEVEFITVDDEIALEDPGEVDSGGVPFELSEEDVSSSAEVEEEVVIDPVESAPEAEEELVEPVAASCAWCKEALPDRPGVNFCPFCGCSVHLVPCPECGEELELNWRFCIACGTEVSP